MKVMKILTMILAFVTTTVSAREYTTADIRTFKPVNVAVCNSPDIIMDMYSKGLGHMASVLTKQVIAKNCMVINNHGYKFDTNFIMRDLTDVYIELSFLNGDTMDSEKYYVYKDNVRLKARDAIRLFGTHEETLDVEYEGEPYDGKY